MGNPSSRLTGIAKSSRSISVAGSRSHSWHCGISGPTNHCPHAELKARLLYGTLVRRRSACQLIGANDFGGAKHRSRTTSGNRRPKLPRFELKLWNSTVSAYIRKIKCIANPLKNNGRSEWIRTTGPCLPKTPPDGLFAPCCHFFCRFVHVRGLSVRLFLCVRTETRLCAASPRRRCAGGRDDGERRSPQADPWSGRRNQPH